MRPKTKYKNVPTVVDGIRFASKKEARRYSELRLLEKAGEIYGLTLQPEFPCDVNGVRVCVYRADFAYMRDATTGPRFTERVVEDSKGIWTPTYRLKKKLVEALYGIAILET